MCLVAILNDDYELCLRDLAFLLFPLVYNVYLYIVLRHCTVNSYENERKHVKPPVNPSRQYCRALATPGSEFWRHKDMRLIITVSLCLATIKHFGECLIATSGAKAWLYAHNLHVSPYCCRYNLVVREEEITGCIRQGKLNRIKT